MRMMDPSSKEQVRDLPFDEGQSECGIHHLVSELGVARPIRLGTGTLNSGSLRTVEHSEVNHRTVDEETHRPSEGVHLARAS